MNEDEELAIDFSKIKNIFSKKKKKEEPVEEKKEGVEQKEKEDAAVDISTGLEKKEESKEEDSNKIDDANEESEEDIKINFSKVKSLFKFKKERKTASEEEGDDINIDWRKFLSFFKKNKYAIPVVLILIAIFASSFLRVQSVYLPITEDWAETSIRDNIKNNIRGQINQQYPNLPDSNRDMLIESEFKKILKQEEDQITAQIEGTANYFRSRLQDEDGQTYLLAIDPYLWYGETRNYLENGHFGTEEVDGKEINFLRNGREGREMPKIKLHSYFGAIFYKIADIFSSKSLMGIFFLIPVIIIGLAIIPAFFIAQRVGGNVGGFFAAIIIAINSALLSRTPAGFSDTDPYNIFFPLFMGWMFIKAFESKNLKESVIFASIGGLLTGLYSYAWGGWWYAFDFILATMVLFLLYSIIYNQWKLGLRQNVYSAFSMLIFAFLSFLAAISNLVIVMYVMLGGFFISFIYGIYFVIKNIKKFLGIERDVLIENKKILSSLVVFFVSSAIVSSLLRGFYAFTMFFRGPFLVIALKDVAVAKIWPNVLTTVAEFNVVGLKDIMSQMGGNLLFFLGVVGIILTVIKKGKDGKRDIKYALFLIIWFIGTAYGFTKGIRFGILMVPAFAVAFGVCIGIIYEWLSNLLIKGIHINKIISKGLVILLLLTLLIMPAISAWKTAEREIPSMNDAWYESLTMIKEDSTDGIITSWWDFGHWFVAVSERRVTFDGADQGERIHWVGKSLLTSSEDESVGILRMLNCGQEKAPHVLEEKFEVDGENDTVRAIDVLNEIFVLEKKDASRVLEREGLSEEDIKEVLEVTHCDDLIDQYYITSEDMIGKAGVWGHFGSWDFKRAKMYQSVNKLNSFKGVELLVKEFNLSEEKADQIYYEIQNNKADQWVSGWPGYLSGESSCSEDEGILKCGNGVEIDLNTMKAYANTQNGKVLLKSISYIGQSGEFKLKEFEKTTVPYSVALLPNGNSILMDQKLVGSMFTRLFFFEGHGLEHFSLLSDKDQVTGGKIQVWKVGWDGGEVINTITKVKEVMASHILIKTDDKSDEEALDLINEILEKVNDDNFAELAKELSEGPSNVNGGSLGWFGKGAMVPSFEDAAFSLEKGEISKPIKTQFGYHIIKLDDKREVVE